MPSDSHQVLRLGDIDRQQISSLLQKYGMRLVHCGKEQPIPGSFWGDDEAGVIGNQLHARADTPLHSILHEVSHYICMDSSRRQQLHTNAGSDDCEESAVCYLQILLADELPALGRKRIIDDMDAWGYSFRLGSTAAWFQQDAEDARHWLYRYQLVDEQGATWKLRDHPA